MEPLELLAEWRNQVVDQDEPYLWSDDEALLYLIDAQDMFCRLTGGLKDATTAAICDIEILEEDPWVSFSPYILRFRALRLGSTKQDVTIVNYSDLEDGATKNTDYGIFSSITIDDEDIGTVTHAVLGMEENRMRLVRVPAADDVLKAIVMRLPYPRLDDFNDGALEIGEQHHRALMLWMKYCAYSKHDSQTYDKNLADKNKASFETYCEELANKERERVVRKKRQVKYGGIGR